MPGDWNFEFKFDKKGSFKVLKYQELLLKLREEFEPQFALMKPEEGSVEWTTEKAPGDNIFAKFTYKCTKVHVPQGTNHGTWTLLWNPKRTEIKNNLHARCAPTMFKELSDKIQTKLSKEFPGHFTLKWSDGLSGYGNHSNNTIGGSGSSGGTSGGPSGQMSEKKIKRMIRRAMMLKQWEESERCIHYLPWSYCADCSGEIAYIFENDEDDFDYTDSSSSDED